jgi:stearoyl-CoA desaturase (Delta-9 desaturase)
MQLKHFDREVGTFLIVYHLILLVALPWYLSFRTPDAGIWISALILFLFTGFGVTAGYHRLFSHRSYDVHILAEIFILTCAAMSAEGSVIKWSYNHRIHHKYVDTDRDPYSIKKGFWYAHFTWMLDKRNSVFDDPSIVPDLMRNKLLVFQDRFSILLIIILNLASILVIGYLCQDYWGAFVITFLLRMFFTHHSSFCINSLAHTVGSRPFSQEHTAVNNWLVALLTLGEGYHNFHHTFPADYRNGVRWYQFDPTRIFIWTLSKLRLARNLKITDNSAIIKRRITEEKIRLLAMLQSAETCFQERFEPRVYNVFDSLIFHLDDLRKLSRDAGGRQHVKLLQQRIKDDLREWKQLYSTVLAKQPVAA